MKGPNYQLALAISEAGWSNRETARRVNRRAGQRGHVGIAVSGNRVSRWVRHGEKPRSPVPEILAELLTERLGQSHTPQSLGIAAARKVVVPLAEHHLHALAERAAAHNMPLERYAQKLLTAALDLPAASEFVQATAVGQNGP